MEVVIFFLVSPDSFLLFFKRVGATLPYNIVHNLGSLVCWPFSQLLLSGERGLGFVRWKDCLIHVRTPSNGGS